MTGTGKIPSDIDKIAPSDYSPEFHTVDHKIMDDPDPMSIKEPYPLVRIMVYCISYGALIILLFFMGFKPFGFHLNDSIIIAFMTLIGIPNIYLIWKNRFVRTGPF